MQASVPLLSDPWLAMLESELVDEERELSEVVALLGLEKSRVFCGRDLSGADLSGGQRLRSFNFYGSNLAGADLRHSDFSGCCFDYAFMEGVQTDGATFEGATFFGAVAAPIPWDAALIAGNSSDKLDELVHWAPAGDGRAIPRDSASLIALNSAWRQVAASLNLQAIFIASRLAEEIATLTRLEWAGRISRNTLDADIGAAEDFLGAVETVFPGATADIERKLAFCKRAINFFKAQARLSQRRRADAQRETEAAASAFARAFHDLSRTDLIWPEQTFEHPAAGLAATRRATRKLLETLQIPDYEGDQPHVRSAARAELANAVWRLGVDAMRYR